MWNCVHTDCKYGRRGRARKGGRVGLILGSPLERRRRTWRLGGLEREWPTQVLSNLVASVCCTVGSLAAFQLPPQPPICISVAWPHRAAAAETPQLQTLASHPISYSNSLHSILILIPISQSPFSFHSRTTSFSISCSISTACVCLEPSSACLLTCYHSTAHSRSG